jgi:hypothetical protein
MHSRELPPVGGFRLPWRAGWQDALKQSSRETAPENPAISR